MKPSIVPIPPTGLGLIEHLAREWQPQFWTYAELAASWGRPDIAGLMISNLGSPPNGCLFYRVCGDFGELLFLFASATCRGQGIGFALLCRYHELLASHGCRQSVLEVRVDNDAAKALYERCGYRKSRIRPHYYGRGKDGLDMIKEIS